MNGNPSDVVAHLGQLLDIGCSLGTIGAPRRSELLNQMHLAREAIFKGLEGSGQDDGLLNGLTVEGDGGDSQRVLASGESVGIDGILDSQTCCSNRLGIADGLHYSAVNSDVKGEGTGSDGYSTEVIDLERQGEFIANLDLGLASQTGSTEDILGEIVILGNALKAQVTHGVDTIVDPVATPVVIGRVSGTDLDRRDGLGILANLLIVKTDSQTVTVGQVDLVRRV